VEREWERLDTLLDITELNGTREEYKLLAYIVEEKKEQLVWHTV
jgi:hypothetical protein